jgi:hypothetical protein
MKASILSGTPDKAGVAAPRRPFAMKFLIVDELGGQTKKLLSK